ATLASTTVVLSDSFSSSAAIIIPAAGAANPYPATLQVSGLTGALYQVSVTLSNLNYSFPDDLDILLLGPQGQRALLMSDAGGSVPIANTTLTFDDSAPAPLPDSGPIVSGTFRPSDYGQDADLFPAPAPNGPYQARLSAFSDSNPNGLWSLYVLT